MRMVMMLILTTLEFSMTFRDLSLLFQACGYEFTSKFHRMFTDILTAEVIVLPLLILCSHPLTPANRPLQDLNSKFTAFLGNAGTEVGINYFIRVLQQVTHYRLLTPDF